MAFAFFKNTRFRVRVVPYHKKYYCIQYSNSYGLFYSTLTEFFEGSFDFPDLTTTDQTVLMQNFNTAIEYARKFKTIDDIRSFLEEENEKYYKWYDKYLKYVEENHANKSIRVI